MGGGSGQPGSAANEEKNFWDGFRKGLGLNEGEEIGQETVGGGLRDIGFAMQDTAAHMPGLDERDEERERLENKREGLREELISILEAHGYHEEDINDELMGRLLFTSDELGADKAEASRLFLAIVDTDRQIIGLYTNTELGNYDISDEEYLKNLVGTGQTCVNLGGMDALNEFLESNGISAPDYMRAVRQLEFVMGDEYNEFIAGLPGYGAQTETHEVITSGTMASGGEDAGWQNTCDQIIDTCDSYGLFDENGINQDALERLYTESPEIFENLERLYESLGIVNKNQAVDEERISEIWAYNPDIFINLTALTNGINAIKNERLLEENMERIGWVDPNGFNTEEDYLKYLITTCNSLSNEDPVLAEVFMENNLPEGEEMIYWFDKLREEIGTTATMEFMDGLNNELATEYIPDHTWDPGQTNVGYGTITIEGEDYAIIPRQYGDELNVIESIHCNDFVFNGARFIWNFSLTDKAPTWYPILDILSQVAGSSSSIQIDIDIVEQDGEQRVLIRYYDPLWSSLRLEPDATTLTENNGNIFAIHLDGQHTELEYGYIYCSGGRTMIMPLVYPNDRVVVNGVDITNEMSLPIEISDDLVRRIEEALAIKGINIDLP